MKFPLSGNGDLQCDLDRLIYTRLLIQSNSGGGKSRTLRRILEQTFGHIQHLVLDPEGEFSTLRERHDYVLVARTGGDVAADHATARLLSERLLELQASAILDLYDLSPRDRVKFVREFLEGLVDAPKALWHPALVIVDEAHTFCPEKGDAESADAVKALATRGRKRGFCAVLATQRLSKLDKDVAAECNNKLIGRTGLDVDVKRAQDELGLSKDAAWRLRELDPGEFMAFGPALTKTVTKVLVGPVKTTHPQMGAAASAAPPPSVKVKALLQKLSDLPQEVEEKRRTGEVLNRIIKDLEQKVRRLEAAKPETKTERVEVPTLFPAQLEQMRICVQKVQDAVQDGKHSVALLESFGRDWIAALARVARAGKPERPIINRNLKYDLREPLKRVETGSSTPSSTAAPPNALTGPEHRILSSIAWWNAAGVTEPLQVAVAFRAGYSAAGSAYRNPRGHLNSMGLVRLNGGTITLTEEGRRRVGFVNETPTATMLQEQVLAMLPGPEKRILEPVLKAYPVALPQEEAAEKAGYSVAGSAYRNPRGHLRSLGLIEILPEGLRARPFLFLE